MTWLGKLPPEKPLAVRAGVVPAALPVALDERLFAQHFNALVAAAERVGGVEACLDALGEKQRRLAVALEEGAHPRVFDLVFGARRRLGAMASDDWVGPAFASLRGERADLEGRIAGFVQAVPVAEGVDREGRRAAARLRRAAHDLATEVLHFTDPVRVPLMTRWVWDTNTMSGALRELVAGGEAMQKLPLDSSPATFEAARSWIVDRIADRGIYRDVHFWADLLLAAAYSHYFQSMTGGVLGSDFQRAADPAEQIAMMLGIDTILRGRAREGQ
jgi:hypothetical protein